MRLFKHLLLVICYGIFATVVFFKYGLPSLEGSIQQQLYSDSVTYEKFAELNDELEVTQLVAAAKNLYGPVYVIRLLNSDRISIFAFNFFMVMLSYLIVIKYVEVNSFQYLIILLLNPLIFFSLFGVNKEVFSLLATSLFSALVVNRSLLIFLVTCFVAFLARWQMLIFVVLCFLLVLILSKYRFKPVTFLYIILISISILYPMMISDAFEKLERVSSQASEVNTNSGSSGIYEIMQGVQRNFGYAVVFIPKLIQLSFGSIFKINLNPIDFWNDFVLPLQSMFSLGLILAVFKKRIFSPNNIFIFSMLVFLMLFVSTPVYNSRYLFPASILLTIVLSTTKQQSIIWSKRYRKKA